MPISEPPTRPPRWEERLGAWLLDRFAPGEKLSALPATPTELEPFEELTIPCRHQGKLSATFYPATGNPATSNPATCNPASSTVRGAVLLLHPWLPYGKAYFHRRGRITALRQAGYHVLTPDLPGFGGSDKASHFFDLDLEDALRFLRLKVPQQPVHLWGVSAGGHWAHPLLARDPELVAALFEDVAPHLIEWSWRTSPWGRPFYFLFRTALRRSYRFIDMRRHAATFRGKRVVYVYGASDAGIPSAAARGIAAAAGGELLLIPEAQHLGSIKLAPEQIVAAALAVFARAESSQTQE